MKKIVRQQNYLRELIEAQGNRYLTRQALKCWVRSAIEPLLDAPEAGVVLYRIDNKDGLQGLLKRLEFSEIEAHSFSNDSGNLIENVWANTEFLCVMTHRYVSILIWDDKTGHKDSIRYYSLYNSKLQNEPLDIIKRNSKIDIAQYQEKFNPDRRDNILLNAAIRKILENMEEATSDAVLGYAEKSVDAYKDSDFVAKKVRVIAHEIRNQLSICDLYTEIIRRQSQKEEIDRDALLQAANTMTKSLKMVSNSLLSLKTQDTVNLEGVSLKELVENSVELSKVYLIDINIELQIENEQEVNISADFEKLTAVIINLVKNAVEAFGFDEIEDKVQNGKYIKIRTDVEETNVSIMVSNNAQGIAEPEKIFVEGFTTKTSGSGLGLWICKKTIEEMAGELELTRSSEDFTEFTIKLASG